MQPKMIIYSDEAPEIYERLLKFISGIRIKVDLLNTENF